MVPGMTLPDTILPLIPAFGGILVVLLSLLPPPSSLSPSSSPSSLSYDYATKTVKSIATLGTGNSLGPEQPCIDTGVYVSELVDKALGNDSLTEAQTRTSSIATGVAAGVGGGFNAPVSGVFFALETLPLNSASISNLFLTSISSSLVTHAILNDDLAFNTPELFVSNSLTELPLYVGLGVLSGLTSYLLTKTTSTLVDIKSSLPPRSILNVGAPIFAGLLTGLIGYYRPRVLFFGYDTLNSLLTDTLPPELLITLLFLKIATTSSATASGLAGGQLAPSLFIGATLGGAYHAFLSPFISSDLLSSAPTYALIGAASVLSSKFKTPVFGGVLLFELTRDYDVLLPLLGSAWVGNLVANAVGGERKGGGGED
ncbi:hypothetical protein TrCOL_g2157 [Triparma columacea]|uniref:Chloride channel protein n=1 Tax=Triparma columacea TaxID=722753 RepID=A0A9W7GP57_9STRA|nr:hypothetical protein TrCOL_g2157 [Triparma columacea]